MLEFLNTIIASAHAQTLSQDTAQTLPNIDYATDQLAGAEVGAGDVLIPNLLLIVAIIGMFILLVYLPQKRRTREHNDMLGGLRKGDKIVTTGGIVGKIVKQPGDVDVVIETGEDNKITVLRAAISGKYSDIMGSVAANDQGNQDNNADKASKKAEEKAAEKTAEKTQEKPAAKKATTAKKTTAKKTTSAAAKKPAAKKAPAKKAASAAAKKPAAKKTTATKKAAE